MNIKTPSNFFFLLLFTISIPFTAINAEDSKKIILISDGDLSVTKYEALMMFKDMDYAQRERMSNNAVKFNNLLIDFLIEKKKVNEAKKQELDKQELIQWKILKAENRILSDQLITQYRNNIIVPDNINLLAKEYYNTHPEEFTSEEQIKVAHILLSTAENEDQKAKDKLLAKLEDIESDIRNGKLTFEEAAKLHSDDKGSAKEGGIINFFTKGRMVKAFEEAAFNLKSNGDISKIIESQYGYHLIKLIDRKNAAVKPYEDIKVQLIESETQKYIRSKTLAFSETFTHTGNMKLNTASINEILAEIKKATPSPLKNN